MSRRDEDKKRRRQKRLGKRRERDVSSFQPASDQDAFDRDSEQQAVIDRAKRAIMGMENQMRLRPARYLAGRL